MTTVQEVRQLVDVESLVAGMESMAAKDYMRLDYSRYLYGGWKHPDGRWIERGHVPAQAFHEANKLLFCPKCWFAIGFVGSDIDERFSCHACGGEFGITGKPDETCGHYDLLFISGGNQSSKSFTGITEFCSWIAGSRAWDGSLTCVDEEPGLWLLCGPTHTTHFPDTLCPYFEERLGHLITRRHKDANGSVKRYDLKTGDQVVCVSYEQVLRAGKQSTAAVEGPRYKGAFCDEPPPHQMFPGIMRGLMKWQSRGWGKIIIAATALHHEYLFNQVKGRSWNMGGDVKTFYSIEFTFEDNPALTQRARDNMEAACSPEEREARLYGRSRTMSGRVYPMFYPETHVYPSATFDPLVNEDGSPSDWPIIQACDPHDVRPFAITWAALAPNGDRYYVANWPEEPYHEMRKCAMSFTDYTNIFAEVENQFPGGPERVTQRILDPKFGPTKKAGMVEGSVQDAFYELGYDFDTSFTADVAYGHGVVREALRYDTDREIDPINRPKAWVSDKCRNIIWAMMNYTRKPDADPSKAPSEQVRDAGKDFADCVRFTEVAKEGYRPWMRKSRDPARMAAAGKGWDNYWGNR